MRLSLRSPILSSRLAAGIAVVVLAALAVSGAAAPNDPGVSTTWGPSGAITSTESTVTVRWDNGGATPPEDMVPRDGSQVVPHTGGKTYADIPSGIRDPYRSHFGKMSLTVSQTTNLVNQAVSVRFDGVDPGGTVNPNDPSYFRVFECWGAADDAERGGPDPARCEEGVSRVNSAAQQDGGLFLQDPPDPLLADGGDWKGLEAAPFTAIDGTTVPVRDSGGEFTNPYFSRASTNELAYAPVDTSGRGSYLFEVQTGAESPGLGCGLRADAPSTASCWLVAVPMDPDDRQTIGVNSPLGGMLPLSPSIWAQRLQVRLSMAPVAGVCGGDAARTLGQGSELMPTAMASWIPALCDREKVALGYTVIADAQAREGLANGSNFAFTSEAVDGADPTTTVYTPVALTGVSFAFTIDDMTTKSPITRIKINARLVVKLLTQSYRAATDNVEGTEIPERAPWMSEQPERLIDDPEFRALNPDLDNPVGDITSGGDLMATITRSDAVDALWNWIIADPGAKAFLDGCPDDHGMVINPFYSTATFAECPDQARELRAQWAAKVAPPSADNPDGTAVPDGYVDTAPVYPPDSAAFPQIGWYERPGIVNSQGKLVQLPLTLGDLHQRMNALANVASMVFRAIYPSATTWCPSPDNGGSDLTCVPYPGVFKSNGNPQLVGRRDVMGVTDTADAARFQLPTALLCSTADATGQHCVGADSASLQKAASEFGSANGVATPAATADYAGGAYPLTLPVYAAVTTNGLAQADAAAYAKALAYMTTTGQTPGAAQGELPPGYAPLTDDLESQAASAIAALQAVANGSSPPAPETGGGAVPEGAVPVVPTTRVVPPPVTTTTPPGGAPAPSASAIPKASVTPADAVGFPQFGLVVGLVGAVLAGVVAPVLARRRRAGGPS